MLWAALSLDFFKETSQELHLAEIRLLKKNFYIRF